MTARKKHYLSSYLLLAAGVIVAGMGVYFIFLRPPLLPEDPRFMGASMDQIDAALPGLKLWLRRVFWVLGGYMFSTGVLIQYLAVTVFRTDRSGAFWIASVAWATSMGLMAVVNFIIASDFKWVLFGFAVLWASALVLYRTEGRSPDQRPASP